MINVEIFGVPGAGKSTLIRNSVNSSKGALFDFESVCLSKLGTRANWLRFFARLASLNTTVICNGVDNLLIAGAKLSLLEKPNQDLPLFINFLQDLEEQGFTPSPFWLNRMLLSMAFRNETRNSEGFLLCDESFMQRLLNIIIKIPRFDPPLSLKSLIKKSILVQLDVPIEMAIKQALKRDGGRRTKKEIESWVVEHASAMELVKPICDSMSIEVLNLNLSSQEYKKYGILGVLKETIK
jgi:hypothetical protein